MADEGGIALHTGPPNKKPAAPPTIAVEVLIVSSSTFTRSASPAMRRRADADGRSARFESAGGCCGANAAAVLPEAAMTRRIRCIEVKISLFPLLVVSALTTQKKNQIANRKPLLSLVAQSSCPSTTTSAAPMAPSLAHARGVRLPQVPEAPIGSHRQRLAPTRAAVSPVEDFERDMLDCASPLHRGIRSS
jgi:hypothetical protein